MPAVAYISLAYVRMAVRPVSNPDYLCYAGSATRQHPVKNWDGRMLHGRFVIESRRTYP